MSKHTPGPWTLVASRKGWQLPYQIEDSDGLCIVALEHHPVRNNKANASLIAAAPDLLEALRNLSAIVDAAILSGDWKVDGACDPDMDVAAARAAIAKARGDA